MNKSQENKFSMYLFVEQTCNENKKLWSGIQAFANAKSRFSNLITEIHEQKRYQELDSVGMTKKRHDRANKLIAITSQYISIAKVYALVENDMELHNHINYTKTNLVRSRDTALYDKCMLVYTFVRPLNESLMAYGASEEMLVSFYEAIREYKSLITGSRDAITNRKLSTEKIATLISETDVMLRGHMDNLIKLFEYTSPDFFKKYRDARKVIHNGMRKKHAVETMDIAA